MYDHQSIEKKWQKRWEDERLHEVKEDEVAPKEKRRYVLDMFPYPSASGLHVGHPEGYTATDIYYRYLRMRGFSVLHPMGWDAFGLPAENYAIKQGVHPRKSTWKNIDTFRRQIKSIGFSYDWSREINTADPKYYRWTQWFFLFLYRQGLAYRKKAPVNWCVSCKTVLAREQVVEGKCERCKNEVVQKELEQWFFKITKYADRLLEGLDKIDWPEPIKLMQRNWIGKSEGALIKFSIFNSQFSNSQDIEVFTTRPDTIFGATYLVVAPEHAIITNYKLQITNYGEVKRYITESQKKTELQRTDLAKEKTGVELQGVTAINPVNGEEIPIWVADYVLMNYGTGAIMGVPAHDARDFEFTKKFGLPYIKVIVPRALATTVKGVRDIGRQTEYRVESECFTGDGELINSGYFTGMFSEDARRKIVQWLQEEGFGIPNVQYKLRDWLISRQRYWGAPIPIIYCPACGEVPLPENALPVILPDDVDFLPTGESPLARSKSFHNVSCPKCGSKGRRESDTMDTFVCSSWYLYRYTDPENAHEFASKEKMAYWLPVDVYVGGAEHAVMHLLYARFFCKALYDAGYVTFDEPFAKLINQGLIRGEDGQKMSKSRGNVINPDDVVAEFGADTLRMYEMFMGPLEDGKPWSTRGIIGVRRFLEKVCNLFETQISKLKSQNHNSNLKTLEPLLHKTIKKVTEDIEQFKFNTAISQMMIFVNELQKKREELGDEQFSAIASHFLPLLAPFAPHITEELWSRMGYTETVFKESWPRWDSSLIKEETMTIPVQVNGKMRGVIEVSRDADKTSVVAAARANERAVKFLIGKEVKQEIYVEGKVVNFVV